jgi:hypothetical protein
LNNRPDGVSLVPEMRKPFDVLAEGLNSNKNRGDKTPIELFWSSFADWSAAVRRLL